MRWVPFWGYLCAFVWERGSDEKSDIFLVVMNILMQH